MSKKRSLQQSTLPFAKASDSGRTAKKMKAWHQLIDRQAGGDVSYQHNFLPGPRADSLFSILKRRSSSFRSDYTGVMAGPGGVARQSMAFGAGNKSATYTYSGTERVAQPEFEELSEVRQQVEACLHQLGTLPCDTTFNLSLVMWYKDATVNLGWHSDNESDLVGSCPIASLSLGASRDFDFKEVAGKGEKRRVELKAGTLLIMSGDTQKNWKHCIPKRAQSKYTGTPYEGERFNITFRVVRT